MTTVDIPRGEVLRGAFETRPGNDVVVNGPGKFAPSVFVDNGNAIINADVLGTGSFVTAEGSNLSFGNSVGPGQTVGLALNATITIDKPTEFKGTLGWASQLQAQEGPFGEYVDLVGLANADGYSLKNDLLKITSSTGKVIDTVRLQHGLVPQEVVKDAGNVYLTWGYGSYRIPGGAAAGVILPQHH